jgi:hypothetical protein
MNMATALTVNSNVGQQLTAESLMPTDGYQTIFNKSAVANKNISEPDSSAYDLNFYLYIMVHWTRDASLTINCVLIVVGLLVNALVIVVFVRAELRKLSISIYTISLAISDMSLLGVPVFLKWLNELQPELGLFRTSFWCRTHGYFGLNYILFFKHIQV